MSYPKSLNNIQCISPCYEANTHAVHPVTAKAATSNVNFCMIDPQLFKDSKTGEAKTIVIDKCHTPMPKKDLNVQEFVVPMMKFDPDFFLYVYYNIKNIEEGIKWLETNKNNAYRNKERVFNQVMRVYGKEITIVDHVVLDFIQEIMITNMPKIYASIKQYIAVRNGEVTIERYIKDKPEPDRSDLNKIVAFIEATFLNSSEIGHFFSKYIRHNYNDLNKPQFTTHVLKALIEYIIKKINISI